VLTLLSSSDGAVSARTGGYALAVSAALVRPSGFAAVGLLHVGAGALPAAALCSRGAQTLSVSPLRSSVARRRMGWRSPGSPTAESHVERAAGYCTARSVNAIVSRPCRHNHSDVMVEALGVDMADWGVPGLL